MELKAWIIDDAEVFAATTGLEAMAAHDAVFGGKAHDCELVDDGMMDIKYPLYGDDDEKTDEFTSIRRLLSEAVDRCWLASLVI